MEYPFNQFGSTVLAMSPPNLLPTPSLLAFVEVKEGCWRDSLDLTDCASTASTAQQ